MMHEISKTVGIKRIPFDQLAVDEQQILEAALKVRNNAQAPYSNYYVGAAVLGANGTTYTGCNVERCTYTQTTHAEQNAIDTMIAAVGPSKIVKIAVVGAHKAVNVSLTGASSGTVKNVVCGHCLQLIWENSFGDPAVKVLNLEQDGIVVCATIDDLLPFRFGPENLNVFYQHK